jgi:hypothetical protein
MTPDTLITFDGVEQPISEHALDYGIPASRIIMRLNAGWSIEHAITRPVRLATGMQPRKPAKADARRSTYTYGGRSLTLRQWADTSGIGVGTIRWRLKKGKPFVEAITTPTAATYTHRQETRTVPQWAAKLGLNPFTIYARLARGASIAEALDTHAQRLDAARLTFDGRALTLKEWSVETGVSVNALRKRIKEGWPVERALTTPRRARR